MSDMDYGQRLREVRFTSTRFSGGYDMAEVDEFLDDLAGLVDG
ncbi:MAG: DivIVA domain-containing protein [Brachybacterium sp.]|nr:DivIVA domain-containing protein [Brachybacterium sp.]